MYYVYILNCGDGKLYTGYTDDLKDRLKRDKSGWIPATKNRLPIKLETVLGFKDKYTLL
jgi:putative endonuclease